MRNPKPAAKAVAFAPAHLFERELGIEIPFRDLQRWAQQLRLGESESTYTQIHNVGHGAAVPGWNFRCRFCSSEDPHTKEPCPGAKAASKRKKKHPNRRLRRAPINPNLGFDAVTNGAMNMAALALAGAAQNNKDKTLQWTANAIIALTNRNHDWPEQFRVGFAWSVLRDRLLKALRLLNVAAYSGSMQEQSKEALTALYDVLDLLVEY
jgi:hypothetical protein